MGTKTYNGDRRNGFRQLLISSERNLRVENWEIRSQAPGAAGEPWSIHKYVLHGGKQEGVDVVRVDNGRLSFVVVPTRGMGVQEVFMGDVRLGWDSPVKEVVHPHYVNLQSRGSLGWLEGFNEWMVRCGLEFAGGPGTDLFIDNCGDEATMELTLHGKIANIPASELEVAVDAASPHRIRVCGRVDERMMYGPKLELRSEISTAPGSHEFQIRDTVTNRGEARQEFQLIYHSNYGPPLLEAGARFVAAARHVIPFNAHAAKSASAYDRFSGPVPGFVEQVYAIHPYADSAGRTLAMLRNAAGDRAVSMSYPVEQLPCFALWKNTLSEPGGYVTGLEPGTGFPHNRRVERKFGRVPALEPGESRTFTIDFTIHTRAADVQEAAGRIEAIQAGRPTQIDQAPAET